MSRTSRVIAPPPYTPTAEEMARDYVPRYHPRYVPRDEPAVTLTVHRSQVATPARSHVSDLSTAQIERAQEARARGALRGAPAHQATMRENRGSRVLRLLREDGGAVLLPDLAAQAGLTPAEVTDATKHLRARGVIRSERRGRNVAYHAAEREVQP